MANPLDTFTASVGFQFQAAPGDNIPGFSQVTTQDNITRTFSFSVGVVANQCNQYLRQLVNLAAGANTTINLSSFVNALNAPASSFARIKGLRFRNLSVSEGGSNATQITIGDAGANSHPMFLGGGANTIVLRNGDAAAWATSGATGVPVNGSQHNTLIVNNDVTNAASVEILAIGGET